MEELVARVQDLAHNAQWRRPPANQANEAELARISRICDRPKEHPKIARPRAHQLKSNLPLQSSEETRHAEVLNPALSADLDKNTSACIA